MEWLAFFGVIIWAVLKAAEKKNAQQKKNGQNATVRQQNTQPRTAAQRSGSVSRPGAPSYAPQAGKARPSAPQTPVAASQRMSQPRPQQMSQPAQARTDAPPASRSVTPPVSQIQSQLTEIKRSERHELEALSRHGHEETSMSGFQDECPAEPDTASAASANVSSAPVSVSGLSFDERSVVAGLLYAEILGKPKALRHESGL